MRAQASTSSLCVKIDGSRILTARSVSRARWALNAGSVTTSNAPTRSLAIAAKAASNSPGPARVHEQNNGFAHLYVRRSVPASLLVMPACRSVARAAARRAAPEPLVREVRAPCRSKIRSAHSAFRSLAEGQIGVAPPRSWAAGARAVSRLSPFPRGGAVNGCRCIADAFLEPSRASV
jgi:hypothetical protein